MYRSIGLTELAILFSCLVAFLAIVAVLAWFVWRSRLRTGRVVNRRPEEMLQVMTLDEVATTLRVDAEAVEGLIKDGSLPAVKVGQEWRFSRSNVIAFIERGGESQKRKT
jgi:excisionase family DNA binding protein